MKCISVSEGMALLAMNTDIDCMGRREEETRDNVKRLLALNGIMVLLMQVLSHEQGQLNTEYTQCAVH